MRWSIKGCYSAMQVSLFKTIALTMGEPLGSIKLLGWQCNGKWNCKNVSHYNTNFVSFTYSISLEEVIFIQEITLLICGNLNLNWSRCIKRVLNLHFKCTSGNQPYFLVTKLASFLVEGVYLTTSYTFRVKQTCIGIIFKMVAVKMRLGRVQVCFFILYLIYFTIFG